MPIKEALPSSSIVDIPLKDLHVQYIPAVYHEKWWPEQTEMMRLDTSPHVDILRTMIDKGKDWDLLFKHPYVKERQARKTVHRQQDWHDKRIKRHLTGFLRLYKSLKKRGYDQFEGNRKPVMILKKPLWETRMGIATHGIVGPEIYDGAHRCTCAYVLGWDTIRGCWGKDVAPGTKRVKKWEGKVHGLYNSADV